MKVLLAWPKRPAGVSICTSSTPTSPGWKFPKEKWLSLTTKNVSPLRPRLTRTKCSTDCFPNISTWSMRCPQRFCYSALHRTTTYCVLRGITTYFCVMHSTTHVEHRWQGNVKEHKAADKTPHSPSRCFCLISVRCIFVYMRNVANLYNFLSIEMYWKWFVWCYLMVCCCYWYTFQSKQQMHIPCISQLLKSKSSAFCKLELQLPKQLLTREMLLAMDEAKPLILLGVTLGVTLQLHQILRLPRNLCTRNLCPGRGGAAGGTRKRENAKTPSTETGKNENAKTAKTRKRRKRENGENTIHSVVLWTRTLSQIWACVGMYASSPFRILRTQTLSQLWACVKYAPKQPSP